MDRDSGNQDTEKPGFQGMKQHMKRGLSLFKQGEFEQAIREFETILAHDRNYVRAYNNLGYIYRTIGDYEKAMKVWSEGLKIDPSYKRLEKNLRSLKRILKSSEETGVASSSGVEPFEAEIGWVSENCELVEIFSDQIFDLYIMEDEGQVYALRAPKKDYLKNPSFARGFDVACRDWLSLEECEYVAGARSFDLISERPFLTFEYSGIGTLRHRMSSLSAAFMAPGESFESCLKPRGLPLGQVVDLAIRLCSGFEFIHGRTGKPHGNIRPESILICDRGTAGHSEAGETKRRGHYTAKIADVGLWRLFQQPALFGTSKEPLDLSFARAGLIRMPSGYVTCSPSRCAPELIENIDTPTPATDIFAFGTLLYEMLTGFAPFSGSDPKDLLERMRSEAIESPSAVSNAIPPVVGNLVMKCMSAGPQDRYQSFSELAAALIEYVHRVRPRLAELGELCGQYEKVSKSEFRHSSSDSTVSIVPGTEFHSEVDQICEIVRRQAEEEGEIGLLASMSDIEETLTLPGLSLGDIYPTSIAVDDALTAMTAEEYGRMLRDVMGENVVSPADKGFTEEMGDEVLDKTGEESSVDVVNVTDTETKPDTGGSDWDESGTGVLTEKNERLVETVKSRIVEQLSLLPDGSRLVEAFEESGKIESSMDWLEHISNELSSFCDIGSFKDISDLEKDDPPSKDLIVVAGFLLMLVGEYSSALEVFGNMPNERYVRALDIYIWAMSEFKSDGMGEIRSNSLKNATTLLTDDKTAPTRQEERSAIVGPSDPALLLARIEFLHGLVAEQLGEPREAVERLRICKRTLTKSSGSTQTVFDWANLVQGKCMYDLGMPSEALLRWKSVLIDRLGPPFFRFLELGMNRPSVLLARHVLKSCESVLERFMGNTMLWCLRGKLLTVIERHEEAFESFSRALAIEKNFYPAYVLQAEMLSSMNRHEEALDALREATLLEPTEPLLMLREAELLCQLNHPDRAVNALKRALEYGVGLPHLRSSMSDGRLEPLAGREDFTGAVKRLRLA